MTSYHVWVPCFKKRGESRLKLTPIDGVRSFTTKESCELHIRCVRVKAMGINDPYLLKYIEDGFTIQPAIFTRGRW